jgi:hypothetical protein
VLKRGKNMRGRVEAAVDTNARAARRALPPGARVRRLLLIVAAALGLVSVGAPDARAQANATSLTPLRSPNGVITLIPSSQGIQRAREYFTPTRPWWISYDDCVANDIFTFSLSASVSGDTLEVWAGTENCATNRSNGRERGQCWIVAAETIDDDNVKIEVPVRNVLARRLNDALPPTNLGDDVCDDSTDANGEAISWYFMVVEGGQASEYIVWNGNPGGTGFDVVGPRPPGTIKVGVGERQLAIELDNVTTDTTRERYEAFCVPEGTTWASLGADAGVTPVPSDVDFTTDAGDAGLDGGVGTVGGATGTIDAGTDPDGAPAACFTEIMRQGGRPPPEQFSCGTANAVSRTLRTSRLPNNVNFAVAVSGQDDLGNAGLVSDIQCGTPIPLADFYELYSRGGGIGGGGFCNFSPERRSNGAASLAVGLLVLAGLSYRRSRGRA